MARIPGPRAIDPRSGFEVPHSELVKEYRGDFVARRFADKPHPQDFIRPRPERIALANPRPEPPEVGIAQNIVWEDGFTPILCEDGSPLLTEGRIPVL